MRDQPTGMVRVEPGMLPGLIGAYAKALETMTPLVEDLVNRGRLQEAWTEDPVAEETMRLFNAYAVDGESSALDALRRYEIELTKVLDALTGMHAEYHRTNDATATTLRLP